MTDWGIAMAVMYMQLTDKDFAALEKAWLGEYNGQEKGGKMKEDKT